MVSADVYNNIEIVKYKIAKAAASIGRDPDQIKIIAATKGQPLEAMIQAVETGYIDGIGENRVQEARKKKEKWPKSLSTTWHMIGHLQRNKAKFAIQLFDVIQSIDSANLTDILEQRLVLLGKTMPVLIEVKISGEASKYGVEPDHARVLAEHILGLCPHLKLIGLMGIGPLTDEKKRIRSSFALLRRLKEELEEDLGVELPELSMGMSDDFEIAIAEGSTMVRLGRAIFGPRGN